MTRSIGLNACVVGLAVVSLFSSGCKTTPSQPTAASELNNGPDGPRVVPQFYSVQSRIKWLNKVAYKNIDDVPTRASEGCELLNFIAEIPTAKGDVGHSAIAVGNDFYDFGPKNGYRKVEIDLDWTKIQTPMAYAEGSPWWDTIDRSYGTEKLWSDKYTNSHDIKLTSIVENVDNLASDQTVMLIPMEVPKDHAQRIRLWWDKLYSNFPEYKIPGLHCTSTVIRSFEETETSSEGRWARIRGGDVWSPDTVSPSMWTTKLLDDQMLSWKAPLNYRHRCGPLKGQVLRGAVIHVGDDIKPQGGDSLLLDRQELHKRLEAGLR